MRLFPEPALAVLLAGAGLGLWLDAPLPSAHPLLLLALAGVALAAVLRTLRLPAGPALLAAILLLGIWRGETAPPAGLPAVPTGAAIEATLLIADAPAPAGGGRYRFRGQVVAAPDGRPGSAPAGANLLVYALPPPELTAQRTAPYLRYGDTIRLRGRLELPRPIGDFDYAAWLAGQGIAAVMWAQETEAVSTGGGNGLRRALHRTRGALAGALQRAMPAPQSGLGTALLLGIRTELPAGVKDDFRAAGMSHLLAISGLHIGIAMALTLGMAQAIAGRGHPATVAATLVVVWGYAILSGLEPPVTRAAIMGSLALASGLTGRGVRGLAALLLAAAAMVMVEPALLGSLSFQLSFTAMAGVIVGLPVIAALTAAATAPLAASDAWPARWAQYGLTLLIASVVISSTTTLATLPLVALHFGAIPLLSVPATILAMPAMPAALLGAAATALAGLVWAPLAAVVGALAWASLEWLIWVAGKMPPALLPAGWLTPALAAVWYAGLGGLALLASDRRLRRAMAEWRQRPHWRPGGMAGVAAGAAPAVAIIALLLAGQCSGAGADGRLHLYVLDIGQGDAILVATPGGRQVLVDGGPDAGDTLAALGPLLPPGDRTLDAVAATHLDSDHIGGLLGVLGRYKAGATLESAVVTPDSALYPQWRRATEAGQGGRARAVRIAAGHRIDLGDGVALEALYPPAEGLPPGVRATANNGSLALRLTYGQVSFLLAGDIEADAERYLMRTGNIGSDVLKVGHHGSRSSTSAAFLEAVSPQSAAISAGRDNGYGHPHPEVMSRLEGAVGPERVFLTARDGTIEYISDGVRLWVETHGR